MPRRATGQVIEPTDGRGWAIRFRAYGKRRYVTLGTAEEGWNRRRAEAELRHVLADVERGIWQPYEPPPAPDIRDAPTFHEFASEWMKNREPELRPKTVTSYHWMLSGHLLPHFARMRLDRIGFEDVDRYKATKLREGALGPNQINKSIGLLAMILDAAGDYGHVDPARNVARQTAAGQAHRAEAADDRAGAAALPARGGAGAAAAARDHGRGRPAQTARRARLTGRTSTRPAAPCASVPRSRSGHAALAAPPLRQPALRPGRRSGVRGGPARAHRAGLLDEGLR